MLFILVDWYFFCVYSKFSLYHTFGHVCGCVGVEEGVCVDAYLIALAIRWGFPLSRMTTNYQISAINVCYNTSFTKFYPS